MDQPSWVRNEADWLADCASIVQCGLALIEGHIGVIESARAMFGLAHKVRDERDPAFAVFCAIYSESDALPVGEERKNWSPSALQREDSKIGLLEDRWRDRSFQAAQLLVKKYRTS